MNDMQELPPEDRAPQQKYKPLTLNSTPLRIALAVLVALGLLAALAPGSVHNMIVGDSVAHSDADSTQGWSSQGDDSQRRCRGVVSDIGLQNQDQFITSSLHYFTRQGDVSYYKVPASGVTLNYSYADCMFRAVVQGDYIVAEQVSLSKQSTGTVLPATSLGTCASTVMPKIASSQGDPRIPAVYMACR